MKFFEWIMQAFINFFGITQPDLKSRRNAAIFICSLLGIILVIFASFFVLVRSRAH
jgi:hypothetical protein